MSRTVTFRLRPSKLAVCVVVLPLIWAGGFAACGDDAASNGPTGTSTTNTGSNTGGGGEAGNTGSGGEAGGGIMFDAGGSTDDDDDGISNEEEGKNDPNGPVDTDMDGTPDYLDSDSDGDGLTDKEEGTEDYDNDGIKNFQDPYNDGDPTPITLTAISTPFSQPIGIDYHEPTNSVVLSANYPSGNPHTFERIDQDGNHTPFSGVSGLTDEIKIATARSGNKSGFVAGELFVGNGVDGQIVRISDGGNTVVNPWIDLPGNGNGLMRGSLYVDHGDLYGGDLIAVTTTGQVWRIAADGTPTMIAGVGVHLEGVVVVPDSVVRYGPLAGKIIAGAEGQGVLYAFDAQGKFEQHMVGVNVEDIDMILPNENFFGVNYGTGQLLGTPAAQLTSMIGDILLTQESHSSTGLYRLKWDGQALVAQEIPITAESAAVGQWEHVTFAPAGIKEVPEVPPPS